ncbi:MAG: histidinol-phosphatase [Clostridia bacterium]|nr:histidinol-phosphatase [Clostridia bacterium]
MIRENYHTHTHFCDGKNSPEEMVLRAIEKGFNTLGFSGHGHTDIDESYCMSKENTKKYIGEIARLKEKYKDKILILCGIEQDIVSQDDISEFDYSIGSTHYILRNGKFYNVDGSREEFERLVNDVFFGSVDAFAKEYFENVSTVVEKTNCKIIGHFDLISKNFERFNIAESEAYLSYAEKAVERLVKHNVPFEINTGAMARGYRSNPYPSKNILKMIRKMGGKIIFNSDCHQADFLDYGFEKAEKIAKDAGFTERVILTDKGFEEISL